MSSSSNIIIRPAQPSDLPSLSTLHIRSFHSVSSFHRKAFPDTPKIREWWTKIYEFEMADPACTPLIASVGETGEAIGTILIRLTQPNEQGAGVWTTLEYTSDHDYELFKPAIDAMVQCRTQIYSGTNAKEHYNVQFFGVADEAKGTGAGRKLLGAVCDQADREGKEVFVESNGKAKDFYAKFGFEVQGMLEIGGGEDLWEEWMMVRKPKVT